MNFEQMMADLQKEYLASFPEKLLELDVLIAAENHDEIKNFFHKLKGTGRTYGFPEVSDLGAVLEGICENSPDAGAEAAKKGKLVLKAIHTNRLSKKPYDLEKDTHFSELKNFPK
jgi:HPt (histidine-containing phosphotransfer) domain-containing protein